MSKEKNFEEKMKTLEELISALENGEFGLDESIEKYTEAMKLIRECDKENCNRRWRKRFQIRRRVISSFCLL
jgi:exodeoxyribonuclease VII small subunit